MKRSRAAWLTIAILLLVALLVLFLPARWVVPFAQSRLHGLQLGGVHGLVWEGAADRVTGPDGRALGTVSWRLSRSAVWGRLDLQLAYDGPMLAARGELQRDAQGRPVWTDVSLRSDVAIWALPLDASLGKPQGTLTATLKRLVLQANWPIELSGQARWNGALMQTRSGPVALGNLRMELEGSNGVLQGQLHNQGNGPLRVEGQWQASPLGWRLDLLLQPRTDDPALHRWLSRLGRADAGGTVHLHRRGGLAATTPETAR